MMYWAAIVTIICLVAYLIYSHYSSGPTGTITFGDLSITKIPGS
jgi:hypothetical protein